jgi:hypothetical protein
MIDRENKIIPIERGLEKKEEEIESLQKIWLKIDLYIII